MTDQERWNQLKQGNKAALESIYRDHVAALLRYGRKFSQDEQLVEDCIQDLFIELWKNKAGLSATDSILRYLLVAIRRKIIRQQSKRNKLSLSEEDSDYNFEVEIAIDEKIAAEELSQEQQLKLAAALAQLSKRQKEAIYLKYKMGMDYDDICDVMGVNYQSARNLISKGLKGLKQYLSVLIIA